MGQPGSVAPLTRCMLAIHAAAFAVTFAAVWGSLSGTPSAGIRRSPGRASAPASLTLPDVSAAGPNVRPDVHTSPSVPPSVGADTQLAAVAQCSGPRATAVDQPVGAP